MIEIYTDGAYSSSRNKGGWAFIITNNGIKIHHSFFFELNTTNNRMEIQAVLEACYWLNENNIKEAILYTDSMYVIGTMTKGWKRNKNTDLWNLLDEQVKTLNIDWRHVKGHAGNKYNELCDAFATQASL